MSPKQLDQEWQDILRYAPANPAIRLWLAAREVAYKAGEDTTGYTRSIRREYRQIMRGLYPNANQLSRV